MAKTLLIPTDLRSGPNNFNALRLGFALLVVWSHSFAIFLGTEDHEPIALSVAGAFDAGKLAVLAFFAISGFLITRSWDRSRSWGTYLSARVRRIIPWYLVAVSLCSFVVVPAFSSRVFGDIRAEELAGLASNALLQNYIVPSDVFGGGAVNGALWSIPLEFWCYIGILALGALGLLRWRALLPITALSIMALRVWVDLIGWSIGGGLLGRVFGYPNFWLNVLPPFLLGSAAYLYRDRLPRSRLVLATLVCATVVAQTIAAMWLSLAAGVASWFAVERWFQRARPTTPIREAAALVVP